ncbi:lipase [Micromonospora polyrhachis]|uniref:Dienelactone hydrolase n=1 Tax=Micromonospora polyrhachis TaxID=1282883 RepID=A0A7W7WQH7_9ACTN|nr:lipase [Micromonospora polyrhachis]MBB4960035.1 dienelactone hydrolase [Micromonospora polyrhachis]
MLRLSRRALLGSLAALLSMSTLATATTAVAGTAPRSTPDRPATPNSAPLRLELPAPTGQHRVGNIELHLVDSARPDPWVAGRSRELMASIWYPARPTGHEPLAPYLPSGAAQRFGERTNATLGLAAGQVDWTGISTHARVGAPVLGRHGGHPVVLYSPGAEFPRANGTVLVEELASRGYVVVTVDHTYETHEVEFPGGRVEPQNLPAMDPTERNHAVIRTRTQDVRYLLDQLAVIAAGGNPDAGQRPLPRGLGAGLDLSRVGMFGHSAGGFTTAETMLLDSRIDAGVNLDGSLAYSFADNDFGDVVAAGLDRPFLLLGAGLSGGRPHTHREAPEWQSFWQNSTGWKLDLYVAEGEHFTFTDYQVLLPQVDAGFALPAGFLAGTIGTVDPSRVTVSLRAYLTAFLDEHLRGCPQRLLDGPSTRHPDVTFIR